MTRLIGMTIALLVLSFPARAGDGLEKLYNFHEHSPTLLTSGQPKRGDFDMLKNAGVQVIVNMAPANLPASLKDEREIAERHGMSYYFIPVDWDRPSIEDARRFFQIMAEHKDHKVLAHCWMNARSSALVYLYRVMREGRPDDQELSVLKAIWDKNKGYELRNVPTWQKYLSRAKTELK